MAVRYDYIRDPSEIYRRSFSTVRAEADLDALPADIATLAVRLIHACGMVDIRPNLRFTKDVAAKGATALAAGAPILADCQMVLEGIIQSRLPSRNKVLCTLNVPEVPHLALEMETTRSAAAVELWRAHLEGAVVVIGNAPTALFHLMERLSEGWPRPAAVIAFPVGFVGAAESKAALHRDFPDLPHITLLGRRGGSAMASAALNALAGLAASDEPS